MSWKNKPLWTGGKQVRLDLGLNPCSLDPSSTESQKQRISKIHLIPCQAFILCRSSPASQLWKMFVSFHSVLQLILHSLDMMLSSAIIIIIALHSQTCSVCNHSAGGDSRRQTPVQWSWRGLYKVLNSSVGLVSSLLCKKEQNDHYQSRIRGHWAGHSRDCLIQFMQFYENEGQQTLEKMLKMSPLDCIKSTLVLTLLVALSFSLTAQWTDGNLLLRVLLDDKEVWSLHSKYI